MKTRALAVATAGLLVVGAVIGMTAAGHAASPTTDPTLAAKYGAHWLGTQAQADGSYQLLSNPYSDTAVAALAFAAAGVDQSQFQAAITYLHDNVGSFLSGGGNDDPGSLGLAIMAVVAGGQNPSNFNGQDLVAALKATRDKRAPGLYGSKDPSFDGATRQSLALMGLSAAGTTDTPAVQWLQTQQCPDKGWQAFRSDTSAPCQPTDLSSFGGEDTNSTAAATEALVAQGAAAPHGNPLDWLKGAQNADGGFGVLVGNATDANSTGLVTQAIVARGESPTQGRWVTSTGTTPDAALLSLQIGCEGATADRGAFAYQPDQSGALKANGYATAQAIPGAAGKPFPLPATTLAQGAPSIDCSAAGATTTTTTSATAASTTTTTSVAQGGGATNVLGTTVSRPASPVATAVSANPSFTG